jgi:hypothetical protein
MSKDDSLTGVTKKMNTTAAEPYLKTKTNYTGYLLTVIFLLFWPIAQRLASNGDPSIGFIDPNIWLLILLSLICFMVITGLCWWLLQRFWLTLGLPDMGNMVSQFKTLKSWQQLSFFWASFALLLLTMLGVLSAIL